MIIYQSAFDRGLKWSRLNVLGFILKIRIMFTWNDMLKFAESQFERIGRSVVVADINLDRFIDTNPKLEATQQIDIFEFESTWDMWPFAKLSITAPKGTRFRMMQCDIPDA